MKAPFSPYLAGIAPCMKQLVDDLGRDYDYVSVLSTDSVGFTVVISQHNKAVSNSNMTTERGNVVRVRRNGLYSEYAFNQVQPDQADRMADQIRRALEAQMALLEQTGSGVYSTGPVQDDPITLFVEKETGTLPEKADIQGLIDLLTRVSDQGMQADPGMLECSVNARSTHISKMFLTANRDMRQSYVYSEASIMNAAANQDGENRMVYEGISACAGPEIFEGLLDKGLEINEKTRKVMEAGHVVPGEYDIITDPGISGLIAHEAFGHGVEMDMFVKNRALGKDYIGKRVGSDLVTMHEGALCADSVTAFAFDDEGTLAGDVTEIDHGILKTGICDALSAVRLGIRPTGNGKRENFAHKAYTRMTNTVFDSGEDSLEDMIASIDYGYLLEGTESGMEDPKHWGIQCIMARGYEIEHGKLTGKVVAPVIMTGYVPDLLGSISMASRDRRIDGNGACGKGYKEWVKVADGGPYLKMKARLG